MSLLVSEVAASWPGVFMSVVGLLILALQTWSEVRREKNRAEVRRQNNRIEATGDKTLMLSNGAMTAALETIAILRREKANRGDSTLEDRAAAEQAERTYRDHRDALRGNPPATQP